MHDRGKKYMIKNMYILLTRLMAKAHFMRWVIKSSKLFSGEL